jgi:hypothetical protein
MADCVHLMRLSREDEELQKALRGTLGFLDTASKRTTEIIDNHRERADG